MIVDGSSTHAALTPDTSDWVTGPFDMIEYKTGASLTGREFKLDWAKDGDGQYAQVQFIEIDYTPGFQNFIEMIQL